MMQYNLHMTERAYIDYECYRENTNKLTESAESFRRLVDEFPEGKREEQLFGEWTLKEILSHFSAWAVLTLDSIRRSEVDEPIPILLDNDVCDWFNREGVRERKALSWDEVYGEYVDTESRLHQMYRNLSEAETVAIKAEFLEFCIEGEVEHYAGHLVALKQVMESM
jgi:hypothetical protein